MAPTWTPAQKLAIQTRGQTLLISAAAGSGKTYTLTQRIIQRLTDSENPVELSRLLIVTYTRAAAAELRERIGKALTEAIAKDPGNRHLRRQLLGLGSAHISTIDSFVMDPVKAHFTELHLSAKTRIADEAELLPLSERVMGDLMEEFYVKYAPAPEGELFSLLHNNPFADLCDSLTSSKNDSELLPLLRSLYDRLLSFPEGIKRLEREADELEACADKDFFTTTHGALLREWLGEFTQSAQAFYKRALAELESDEAAYKAYGNAFCADQSLIQALLEVHTYADAHVLFSSYVKERVGKLTGASPAMAALRVRRGKIGDSILNMGKTYFSDSPAVISRQMRDTARMCRVLYDFLMTYDARILAEKQARGICDFTDNRRYLLRLLRAENGQPTPVAAELAAQYDEVYIDEYQDVDEVQDEIFRLVGGNHRFMVGDLKQSIYMFRGADPSVFSRYRRDFPLLTEESVETKNPYGSSIFMSDNFRCDESVIRVTNAVCGHILRACPDSVGYKDEDDLGYAKSLPTPDHHARPVEITVLKKTSHMADDDDADDCDSGTEEGSMSAVEVEATYVANQIARLLHSGETLANGKRIRPKDITILMRKKEPLAIYRKALTRLGIPTGSNELDISEACRDILHGSDMMYLLNLLRVIDNPDNDIALSELLRAPFPGFTLEELLTIRRTEMPETAAYSLFECMETYTDIPDADIHLCDRIADFLSWIEHYRSMSATQSAHGILRFLSRDEHCACRETEAFRYLYDSARTYRSDSFVSLFVFLRFFEKKLLTAKEAPSAPIDGGEDGHVTLMTIHKSKGLEMPVCFVVRAGQGFSIKSTLSDLIFEKRTGLSMKLYRRTFIDTEENGSIQTQAKLETALRKVGALSIKLSECEEEMRILYVAMTRAKERLYIVGIGTADMGENASVAFDEGDRYATMTCNNYLRWILGGLEAHPEVSDFFRTRYINTDEIHPDMALYYRTSDTMGVVDDAAEFYRSIPRNHHDPTDMELLLGQIPTKLPASLMHDQLLDRCVFFTTDLQADHDGKLPASDEGSRCDAMTAEGVRESLRLMSHASDSPNEFELLLGENRRPTAAERGTAAHLFLQYADYESVRAHGIDEEIARLSEMGFISARVAEVLDRSALQAFFDSSFMIHMREAVTVERELKFHRFVPLASLTNDPSFARALEDRTLYVQGSIDLLAVFSDGHIELCDYKTDRITPAERENPSLLTVRMTERHADQLRQYAAAVEEMYGVRPTKTHIFSLPLGEAVEINLD